MSRWLDGARRGGLTAEECDEIADAIRRTGSVATAKRELYGHASARHVESLAKTDSYLYVKIHDALADWHRAQADARRTEAGDACSSG